MIYTVTCNPSLDYIVDVEDFRQGFTNHTVRETVCAGGKGINVSAVLKTLGYASTAFGFLAGFTGREIRRLVERQGICADFIEIPEGFSRINVKLRSGGESEINGRGPVVGERDTEKLYRKLDRLADGDVLVLSGSIPAGLSRSLYSDIMRYVADRELKIAVDAAGELLLNTLPCHPFLIKPNNHELGEIFGVGICGRQEAIHYARKLQEKGAVNVLVSMAGEGAVFVGADGVVCESEAPEGTVRNSVGAGDSMVAGFLAEYLRTGDYRESFRMGLCAGSATAFSEKLATKPEIERIRASFLLDD